jgi:multidrug transporter EmrE-like cation transporter
MEKSGNFLGTYFSKNTVLRLASVARLISWVVLAVYALLWLIQALAMGLQIARGFWTGMGFTDVVQNVLYLFEQPLRGVVYYVVLQGVSQALLMFMDMEENTRRVARRVEQK